MILDVGTERMFCVYTHLTLFAYSQLKLIIFPFCSLASKAEHRLLFTSTMNFENEHSIYSFLVYVRFSTRKDNLSKESRTFFQVCVGPSQVPRRFGRAGWREDPLHFRRPVNDFLTQETNLETNFGSRCLNA